MTGGRAGVSTQIGWNFHRMTLMTVVGDITGDGNPELLARRSDGSLYRYTITPKGMTGGVKVGQRWNGISTMVGLSRDGHSSELLGFGKDGRLHRYGLTRQGGVGSSTVIGRGWSNMRLVISPGTMSNDARDDLMAVRSDGHLYFYSNLGNGRWGAAKKIGQNWNGVGQIA